MAPSDVPSWGTHHLRAACCYHCAGFTRTPFSLGSFYLHSISVFHTPHFAIVCTGRPLSLFNFFGALETSIFHLYRLGQYECYIIWNTFAACLEFKKWLECAVFATAAWHKVTCSTTFVLRASVSSSGHLVKYLKDEKT